MCEFRTKIHVLVFTFEYKINVYLFHGKCNKFFFSQKLQKDITQAIRNDVKVNEAFLY